MWIKMWGQDSKKPDADAGDKKNREKLKLVKASNAMNTNAKPLELVELQRYIALKYTGSSKLL